MTYGVEKYSTKHILLGCCIVSVTNIKYAIRMEKEKIEKRGARTKDDFSISQLRNSEIAVDTS